MNSKMRAAPPNKKCDVGEEREHKCSGARFYWDEMEHFGKEHGRQFGKKTKWVICGACWEHKMITDPPRPPAPKAQDVIDLSQDDGEDAAGPVSVADSLFRRVN